MRATARTLGVQLSAGGGTPRVDLPGPSHGEVALREVVLAAYPTASVTWLAAGPGRTVSRQSASDLLSVRCAYEPQGSPRGGPLTDYTDAPPSAQPLLARLQECYGPMPAAPPAAYPRCRYRAASGSPDGRVIPLWIPHAVIRIGGFDGADLRERVLPALVEHVPSLPDDVRHLLSRDGGRTRKGLETVQGRRRPPAYVQKKNFAADVFVEKGCLSYGSTLLELSLPGGGGGADGVRERIFATLGSTATALVDLQREPQAGRRALLRGAFGSSLPLLQQSLPRPLVAAAAAARLRTASRGSPEVSSAFWISALAHGLCRLVDASLRERVWVTSASPEMDTLRLRVKERLGLPASDEAFVMRDERLWDSHGGRGGREEEAEEFWLAHALAGGVVEWLATCSPSEWEDTLMRNFFFPVERFDACQDVQALARCRRDKLWGQAHNARPLREEFGPLFDRIVGQVVL